MTIVIPKDLRAAAFTELTLVSINDVDVDRMMPHVFELTVKLGRTATSRTDAKDYAQYLHKVASEHDRVVGFEEPEHRRFLDGWLRTSVIDFGRAGETRQVEQMDHVRPLTIASYRAGLPKIRSKNRGADELVYQLLLEGVQRRLESKGEGGSNKPTKQVSDLVRQSFGQGISFTPQPAWAPYCDDPTSMDISALLSVCFLEGFEPSPGLSKDRPERPSMAPGATRALSDDLVSYLSVNGALPAQVMTTHLAALISFRLFQLPLRLAHGLRHLLSTGSLPPDLLNDTTPNALNLYCDFTRAKGSFSDEMARRCVQRDLDGIRGLFPIVLRMRLLRDAVSVLPGDEKRAAQLKSPGDLAELVALKDNTRVDVYARMRMDDILRETREGSGTDDDVSHLESISASEEGGIDQLTTVLAEALRRRDMQKYVKWFWSTGGLSKGYGVLEGAFKSRRAWRYAPGDDLLTAMLLVVFTEDDGLRSRDTMPIAMVLERLRDQFGVLVDQPPPELNGADARAAAAENLEAFKHRLQLLGCFDSLSDDFSAQLVTRPMKVIR